MILLFQNTPAFASIIYIYIYIFPPKKNKNKNKNTCTTLVMEISPYYMDLPPLFYNYYSIWAKINVVSFCFQVLVPKYHNHARATRPANITLGFMTHLKNFSRFNYSSRSVLCPNFATYPLHFVWMAFRNIIRKMLISTVWFLLRFLYVDLNFT